MPSYTILTNDQIEGQLSDLPGWKRDGDQIAKTFVFSSFREAVSFIVRIGFVCEQYDHHPELTNVYKSVTLTFTTHDAGNAITNMDITVAREIESLSWV